MVKHIVFLLRYRISVFSMKLAFINHQVLEACKVDSLVELLNSS